VTVTVITADTGVVTCTPKVNGVLSGTPGPAILQILRIVGWNSWLVYVTSVVPELAIKSANAEVPSTGTVLIAGLTCPTLEATILVFVVIPVANTVAGPIVVGPISSVKIVEPATKVWNCKLPTTAPKPGTITQFPPGAGPAATWTVVSTKPVVPARA
jgi:hypothetical protein